MTNIEETYDHLLPVQTCGKGSSCRLSTRAGSFTIRTLPLNKPFSYCFSFDLLLKPLQFSLTTLPTCCPFTFFFAKLNPEPFKSGFFSERQTGRIESIELSCNELWLLWYIKLV
uniref:Uncharacterized protein n=1 Tax=Salix viminalis TaxID=40686 RepID=A0A6N2MRK2_SALVM